MGSVSDRYAVKSGSFKFSDRDPRDSTLFPDKEAAKALAQRDATIIDSLQDRLYAERTRALLVVLQGMDCSGKDGTVRGVFNTCGPIGVNVTAFGVPSEEEREHDYLWRIHGACPRRGMIGIFNRSHYEDVLVVKVRKLAPADAIEKRYEQINHFEEMLAASGTRILKFMLHISREEQGERLRERLEKPQKQWKFNPRDLDDRKLWDDYMAAYETALVRCSTAHAPWFVIPADRNAVRNAAIAAIVRETLEVMNPQYPPPDFDPKAYSID